MARCRQKRGLSDLRSREVNATAHLVTPKNGTSANRIIFGFKN
jgi:hypothetical protein